MKIKKNNDNGKESIRPAVMFRELKTRTLLEIFALTSLPYKKVIIK